MAKAAPRRTRACVFLSSRETSTVSWPMPSTDSRKPSSFSARLRSVSLYAAISSSAHFTPAARPRHHADCVKVCADCVKVRRAPAVGLEQSELAGAFDRAVAGVDVELAVDGHRL